MRQLYTVIQRGREHGGLGHREGGTIPFRMKFQKKKKNHPTVRIMLMRNSSLNLVKMNLLKVRVPPMFGM